MRRVFRVWAPNASRVQLKLAEETFDMAAGDGGWWHSRPTTVDAPPDYAFIVDGRGPFPDPRSSWQPAGIHGPSRLLEHEAYEWHDQHWQPPPLAAAVIYELHVGTFTPGGTFESAIDRLDYLVDLGITHVELMPVGEFPGRRNWGYDGVDLFAPHHHYGGPLGLKRLVDACHQRGLAVILDVVYNHLGPAGNYLHSFGPYFTTRYTTPWGMALNLDGPDSDEVRRFLIDNALTWLRDYHVDGLRLDAVHALFDFSAFHFLEELAIEVARLEAQVGRRLALIAESDLNDPRLLRGREGGGYGLDATWSDDFHHALHTALTREGDGYYADFDGLPGLAKALRDAYVYDGRYSSHRRRRHGRGPDGLSGHRFVVCAQNHDQIGNRARGERLSHLVSPGRLKVAAAVVLTSPFIPLLFQGEEWGASSPFLFFTDHDDPELGRVVREGRVEEFASFGWDAAVVPDPQDEHTFARSVLDWGEAARDPHAGLLQWYRRLLALRKTTPELKDGRLDRVRVRFDERRGWLSFSRGSVATVINIGSEPRVVPVDAGAPAGEILLSSEPSIALTRTGVRMPADSAALLRLKGERD